MASPLHPFDQAGDALERFVVRRLSSPKPARISASAPERRSRRASPTHAAAIGRSRDCSAVQSAATCVEQLAPARDRSPPPLVEVRISEPGRPELPEDAHVPRPEILAQVGARARAISRRASQGRRRARVDARAAARSPDRGRRRAAAAFRRSGSGQAKAALRLGRRSRAWSFRPLRPRRARRGPRRGSAAACRRRAPAAGPACSPRLTSREVYRIINRSTDQYVSGGSQMATIARQDGLTGALQSRLRGPVLDADHAEYEEAREALQRHDRQAAAPDRALRRRRPTSSRRSTSRVSSGIDLAVRGGGHNGPGLGSVDDGLMIDLSAMRGVIVDPERGDGPRARRQPRRRCRPRHERIRPGGTVRDHLDAPGSAGSRWAAGSATSRRKSASRSTTCSGSTSCSPTAAFVHGERGRARRPLLGAARRRRQLRRRHRVHVPAQPGARRRTGGRRCGRSTGRRRSCGWYRDFMPAAPDELNGWFAFLTVPPVDPFPKELQLQKVCGVVWCWTGAPEDADEAFRPVRASSVPISTDSRRCRWPALKSAFDALYPPGDQWYWRADFVTGSADEAIEAHVRVRRGAAHRGSRRCTCTRSTARPRGWRRTRPRGPIATRSGGR